MNSIDSSLNTPDDTAQNENVSASGETKQQKIKSSNIPKYLYFVIPSALVIAGLLAYIFLSGGMNSLLQDQSIELIPEDQIQKEIGELKPTGTPSPTGTPIPIIKGEETYSITQGKTNGPKITKAVINPHDPSVGMVQKFTLYVNHTAPVTGVKITLKSDNKTEDYQLSLTSGTPLEGQWSGTWEITDTHLHTYAFVIEVTDGKNNSSTGIAIR